MKNEIISMSKEKSYCLHSLLAESNLKRSNRSKQAIYHVFHLQLVQNNAIFIPDTTGGTRVC